MCLNLTEAQIPLLYKCLRVHEHDKLGRGSWGANGEKWNQKSNEVVKEMCRFSQDCRVRIQSPQIWLSIGIANNCSTSTNHHYHPLPPLTISTNLHCHHQPWQLPTKHNHQPPPLVTNHHFQQYPSTIMTTTNYDNYQPNHQLPPPSPVTNHHYYHHQH